MDPEEFSRKINGLAELLNRRLRVRGRDFETLAARAIPRLPRGYRADLQQVADAWARRGNPRLLALSDPAEIDAAIVRLSAYLKGLNPWSSLRATVMDTLGMTTLRLMIVAGITFAVLRWRGFV